MYNISLLALYTLKQNMASYLSICGYYNNKALFYMIFCYLVKKVISILNKNNDTANIDKKINLQ